MNTRQHTIFAFALLAACKPSPDTSLAPRFVMGVGASQDFTVFTATFVAPRDLRYHDAHCTAVGLEGGAEPPSLAGGRVEVWVAAGPVLGHVDQSPDGRYQAAVRAVLPHGTRLAGSIAGGPEVPAYRFRAPARVPAPVHKLEPSQGFVLHTTRGITVRWEGGDSSHVTTTLSFEPPAGSHGPGALISCVVPRAPQRFTITPAVFAAARVPREATSVTLVVAATDRVRAGDHALDVSLVGSTADEVFGSAEP
jgi:hypothetical protein